jgi:hypothetical protein
MSSPNDRRYLQSHEWHKPEGDLVKVGISRFAVDELTDVPQAQSARFRAGGTPDFSGLFCTVRRRLPGRSGRSFPRR